MQDSYRTPDEAGPFQLFLDQFILFDDHTVHVESVSAELTITQPREIARYTRAFHELATQAVHGRAARSLITRALTDLG